MFLLSYLVFPSQLLCSSRLPSIRLDCPRFVMTASCPSTVKTQDLFRVRYTLLNNLQDFLAVRLVWTPEGKVPVTKHQCSQVFWQIVIKTRSAVVIQRLARNANLAYNLNIIYSICIYYILNIYIIYDIYSVTNDVTYSSHHHYVLHLILLLIRYHFHQAPPYHTLN